MSRLNVIAVANEQVSIVTVCQMLGVDLPDDVGMSRSQKVHCPFGEIYHSDLGTAPAMRIYADTNSAYCFSCSAYFTPVALAAKAMDIDRHTMAVRLLDRVGYRELELAEVFSLARDYEPPLDRALLADALKTYCRRIDAGWSSRQFEAPVASALSRCLALLDLVKSGEDVTVWLDGCKLAMKVVLETGSLTLSKDKRIPCDDGDEVGWCA